MGNVRKKRRVTASMGERVGSGAAKCHQETSGFTTLNSESLTSVKLILIPKGDNFNQRQRDIVNLRGVKICFWVRNNIPNGIPLYFNWALITPKADNLATIPNTDFFRDTGIGTDRTKNFAATQDWLDGWCSPINTDKYRVHTHKRLRIAGVFNSNDAGPSTTNAKINVGQNGEVMIEKYIKINRQIRFSGTNEFPVGPEMFMVWWCQGSGLGTSGAKGFYQYRTVMYFKEPKN